MKAGIIFTITLSTRMNTYKEQEWSLQTGAWPKGTHRSVWLSLHRVSDYTGTRYWGTSWKIPYIWQMIKRWFRKVA